MGFTHTFLETQPFGGFLLDPHLEACGAWHGMEGAGGFRFNFSIDEVLAVKCGPRLH